MDYDVDSAPMTGQDLFRMVARLAVPDGTDVDALRGQLREMEDEYNFDVLFRFPVD